MDNLEGKSNDVPIPGETRVMSKEKEYELCVKGTQTKEAKEMFEYLRRWRIDSNKSDFTFYASNFAA